MLLVPQEVGVILDAIGRLAQLIKKTEFNDIDELVLRERLTGMGFALLEESVIPLVSQWIGHYCGLKLDATQPLLTQKHGWQVTYQPRFEMAIESAQQQGIPESFFRALADVTLEVRERDLQAQMQHENPKTSRRIIEMLESISAQSLDECKISLVANAMRSVPHDPDQVPIVWSREICHETELIITFIGGNPLYIGKTMGKIVKLFGDPIAEEWDGEYEIFKASWPIDRLAEAKRKQAPQPRGASPYASPN